MPARWRISGPLIAFIGGIAGLVGAAVQEVLHGWFFGPFIAGPIIEEAMQKAKIY